MSSDPPRQVTLDEIRCRRAGGVRRPSASSSVHCSSAANVVTAPPPPPRHSRRLSTADRCCTARVDPLLSFAAEGRRVTTKNPVRSDSASSSILLGDLYEVAAGVVEHGSGDRAHGRRRLSETDTRSGKPGVLSV